MQIPPTISAGGNFLSSPQIKKPADFTLLVNCFFLKLFLCLVDRSEQLHLIFDGSLDSLEAGCEKLSGVEALALEILARLDVLSGSVSESELALGVDVDLGNAEGDSFLYHVCGDACAAVENEGHLAGELLDVGENIKSQALPVCGILAVDVADARCEHIDAEISDHLAFVGVSDLAAAYNAVLFAADGADFSLNGNALRVSESDYLLGLLDVLLNAVEPSNMTEEKPASMHLSAPS